jgi:ABC-type glycerol-3-phosphate transport system permease component
MVMVLVFFVIISLVPIGMTLNLSQKEPGELVHNLWRLPRGFHPEFYAKAWTYLFPYMLNSLIVSVFVVGGVLVFSTLSGYAFSRLVFPGRDTLFAAVISLLFIPGVLTLIPMYLWVKEFPFVGGNNMWGEGGSGLLNTWWAMILPGWAWGQLFGIYIFRTFFASVPTELLEAARIEGAGELRILWSIMIPLSVPIVVAVAMIQFIGVYNDYIWPLATISDSTKQMFGVGVTRFVADGNLEIGPMMAGYVIGAIPLIIVFAFGMKYYVAGVTQGAIR